MSDSFRTELRKFDAERVLPAWDNLVRGQQARFEELKAPTMFVTNDTVDTQVRVTLQILHEGLFFGVCPHAKHPFSICQKQRKVVQLLEDILSTSDRAQ